MLLLLSSAFAAPLLVERFDQNTLPADWKLSVGAQTGGGPQNEARFEGGAVVLSATAKTRKFTAVSKKLDLRGISWIRVNIRMKTDEVDPTGARYLNSDAFVRFEGGDVQPLRVVTGTTDWTTITRSFAVPKGARDVEIGLVLTMPGTVTFDDLIVEPVEPDWKSQRRGNFVYHWIGRDGFTDEQLELNDTGYDRIAAFLGVSTPVAIDYWRYTNLDAIEEYTGRRGNGHVEGNAVHTIWRSEDHEVSHVLARAWGDPPALLAEGLAVHLSGGWDGKDIRLAARGAGAANPTVTLASLLDTKAFRGVPEDVAYPIAGAFAGWVIDTKGKETLQKLYGQLGADPAANTKAIEAALGMSLADADTALRGWW